MHVLLSIGCFRYLLPDDKGIHTVIRTLAKAVEVKLDRRRTEGRIELGERPEVGIEYLPGYRIRSTSRAHAEILQPEVLPAHEPYRKSHSLSRLAARNVRLLTGGSEI